MYKKIEAVRNLFKEIMDGKNLSKDSIVEKLSELAITPEDFCSLYVGESPDDDSYESYYNALISADLDDEMWDYPLDEFDEALESEGEVIPVKFSDDIRLCQTGEMFPWYEHGGI